MPNRRFPSWLWLMLAPGLAMLAIPALWIFVSLTAKPLYRKPEDVPATTQAPPMPRWANAVERARAEVRTSVAAQNLPGVSVAVGVNGELAWAEGFGFADLSSNTPVRPDHRFRIGTASTVLTAAAAGLLVENGALKLDDEIQAYVPSFPRKHGRVTVRELMAHEAGVINDGGDEGPLFAKHCQSPVEALPTFVDEALLFKPGSQYRHSSYGWILVSAAVETAAGRPLLAFMREGIFEPIGMRQTVPDAGVMEEGEDFPLVNMVRELIHDPQTKPGDQAGAAPDRVTSYFPRFAADPAYGLHVMRPLDLSCYSGAAVFTSTPSDLVRFAMAQPRTLQAIPGRGLGGRVEKVELHGKPVELIGQDGDLLGGRVASLMTFPQRGLAVAVTANISYADTWAIGLRVARLFAEP